MLPARSTNHGSRDDLLRRLAAVVCSADVAHPVRVALDGPPGAGKTTLADELAVVLRAQGREVIRATIEDFLFPRAVRHRRGAYSAEGCYFDTHDYDSLIRVLLEPLGPQGDRQFRRAVYDRTTDASLSLPATRASADAVLLFDGVFLLRPELTGCWESTIFVSTAFETTVSRAHVRERGILSGDEVERLWRRRYIPSQQYYVDTVRPADHADIVVLNDEPERPRWRIRTP